jgi:hypothetical protein
MSQTTPVLCRSYPTMSFSFSWPVPKSTPAFWASAPALSRKFSDPPVILVNWLAAVLDVSDPVPLAVASDDRL